MTRRDDPGRPEDEGPDDERPRGLIRSLLDLLQEMEERGERTRSGHSSPGRHTSVDYSISIGGLSDDDPLGSNLGPQGGSSRSDDSATEAHVTTRETPDGLVVAADLPTVEAGDVDVRVDSEAGMVVIEVADRDTARLPLESDEWSIVDSRFANGVLEVELRRD